MDAKENIKLGLDEYMDDLRKALDGLTPEERRFQPDPPRWEAALAVTMGRSR